MPLYTYKCPTCTRKRDIFKALADLDRVENCTNCGFAMNRQLTAPFVQADNVAYKCPITGKMIEGRRAHEENLAKHGCRILEEGESNAYRESLRAADEALDRSIEESVAKQVESLPQEKLEKLQAEMDAGIDVSVQRATITPN